jgi:hypothetical protein
MQPLLFQKMARGWLRSSVATDQNKFGIYNLNL